MIIDETTIKKLYKLFIFCYSLIVFTILMCIPMFKIYRVGGVIDYIESTSNEYNSTPIIIENTSEKEEINDQVKFKDEGTEITNYIRYKDISEPREYKMNCTVYIEENSIEHNPLIDSDLFSPLQLIFRIIDDINNEEPYKIKKIGFLNFGNNN